jgi:hypothetical protein
MQVKIFTGTEGFVADITGWALGNGQPGELRAQNGQNPFARPAERLTQIK